MHLFNTLRRCSSFLALALLSSVALTSCPPPTPEQESLKVVLRTGETAPAKALDKALTPIRPEELLSLDARIQTIRLLSPDGASTIRTTVFSGPRTVDLLDLTEVSALLASTTAPVGTYTGVELTISKATMLLAEQPETPVELTLSGGGIYTTDFAFEILPDSSGLLQLDLGGIGVFQDETTAFVLAPDLSATLLESVNRTRIEGTLERIDRSAQTLVLAAGNARFDVDYRNAEIFLPGDFQTPQGTATNLVVGSEVAVVGTVGLDDALPADRIEIVDLPGTPEDEHGDQVLVCYFYGENPVTATTLTVSRSRLPFVLEQGGFEGACDGGDPFTVTYAAGPGGSISGETNQRVTPGADGTAVTAVADDGFTFVNWSDGSTLNPRVETSVVSDITVTANFVEVYSLVYIAGDGGTISGNTTQSVPQGGSGSPVTAVRDNSFVFHNWSDGRTDNPRTDVNITADLSVTANFLEIFQLSYTASAGGALEGTTQQSVINGADGSPVTAVPAEGFIFLGWSDGVTDNPRTDLGVTADVTVTANFVAQFTLNYAAGPNGSLSGNTSQTVNGGSDGSAVTAIPDTDFGFAGWSDGRTDNPRTDTAVGEDISVTATFASAVSLTYQAGPNGTIAGVSDQIIGSGGTGSAVTAVPDDGFGFARWSDDRTDNPRVDTGVTSDLIVTAEFVPAFTLNYIAGENGTLTGTTSQVVNSGSSGTEVRAVPDQGFAFRRWSDGGTQNPRTDVNVTTNLTLTAEFIELFTLHYTAGPNGTVTGPLTQVIREGANGREVTAVPNEGFGFVDWSDGRIDNPRTDTVITEDLDVTANFGTTVTLNYIAGLHGSIVGQETQQITVGENATPVSALADEGFLFSQWSDGSTDNPRTDLDVASSRNITATFFEDVEMLPVPAGSFTMGARDDGDDGAFGRNDELPRREVTLDAYEIGKFEVTNAQFAAFMNYMHNPVQDLLRRPNGETWMGFPENVWFFDSAEPHVVFAFSLTEDGIDYDRASHSFVTKRLEGLPEGTIYDKATHPVTEPTWYGAVLFANWLSERKGLEPVYDVDTWEADFSKNGYRLPTEAEWERAAAWDGEKHWVYPFVSDELTTRDRANFHVDSFKPNPDYGNTSFINPLGIIQDAKESYTAPVGWFNGINVSPNGNIQTVDSPSPVGCYDMAGNVVEWCHDWYSNTYYGENENINPTGPATGEDRVARGGAWARLVKKENQRSARRFSYDPNHSDGINGFRLAR